MTTSMFYYEGQFKNILTNLFLTPGEGVTILELLQARHELNDEILPWHEEDASYNAMMREAIEAVIVHYIGEETGARIFLRADGKKPKSGVTKGKVASKKAVKKKAVKKKGK